MDMVRGNEVLIEKSDWANLILRKSAKLHVCAAITKGGARGGVAKGLLNLCSKHGLEGSLSSLQPPATCVNPSAVYPLVSRKLNLSIIFAFTSSTISHATQPG